LRFLEEIGNTKFVGLEGEKIQIMKLGGVGKL
jgi:hypothetical protein